MNANQVVIVMDRENAEAALIDEPGDAQGVEGRKMLLDAVSAALDRDPDEIIEWIAKVLYVEQLTGGAYTWNDLPNKEPWRKKARSVLHALQEGTEK